MNKRAKEAALEKEIDNYLIQIEHWEIEDEPVFWMKQIARNFYEHAEKELIPLINQLCEAILFEWKDAADLAMKILTQIKEREEEK